MAAKLNKKEIERFFQLLDKEVEKDLEQISTKFVLIAVGGTALTLRDIKASTKDMDFMVEDINLDKIKNYLRKIYKKTSVKVDVWEAPFVFSTTLPKGFSSDLYGAKYKHFDVRLINLVDNAITKLARFNEADREDIDAIIKAGIDPNNILRRFHEALNKNCFANKEEVLRNLKIFKGMYGIKYLA